MTDGAVEQKAALQMTERDGRTIDGIRSGRPKAQALVGRRRSDDDECGRVWRGTMEGETDFVTPWEMSSVPATHTPATCVTARATVWLHPELSSRVKLHKLQLKSTGFDRGQTSSFASTSSQRNDQTSYPISRVDGFLKMIESGTTWS